MVAPRFSGWLLLAVLVVAYAPVLSGGFLWDDDAHLARNPSVRDPAGLPAIWTSPDATPQYYPLTFTVFWAAYRLWGLSPVGYHALNLGLHATVALLLWRLLARLEVAGAAAGAALFALHPVNVMSVAWITEVKNTLSSALALAACLAFARFAGLGGDEPDSRRRRRDYALALALFALAMLAKTAVAFVPVTLGLILWWKRDRLARADLLAVLPFALVAAALGAMTIHVERLHGGDVGRTYAMDLAARAAVSGRSFWFYAGKLLFPYPLTFIYPRWTIASGSVLSLVPLIAVAALLAALLVLRSRIGKGPFVAVAHFYVATSVLIFFVVTYFTRFSFVSDHWQYFGMMGAAALAGAGLARLAEWPSLGPRGASAVTASILAVLAIVTWRQCRDYASAETLYRATIARNPEAWMPRVNLGKILAEQGRTAEAEAQYEAVLKQFPHPDADPVAGTALGQAHNNLGTLLAQGGHVEEATGHFDTAVRLDPSYADPHFNLGIVREMQGRMDDAASEYREAIRLGPFFPDPHNNLAIVLFDRGDFAGAWREVAAFQKLGGTPHPEFIQALSERAPPGAGGSIR